MDPRINPYAPGAGTVPPELSGRDDIIEKALIAIDRCRNLLSSRGLFLVGLRGVGKTVLLNRIANEAEAKGFAVAAIETPEERSLPALLIPNLRTALLRLDKMAAVSDAAKRALRALGSFVGVMKAKFNDIEFGLDLGSEPGVADTGDMEHDLIDILIKAGEAAKEKKTAVIFFIDEIQYIDEDQFATLIMAIHKCTQKQLPISLIGAGLPQLIAQAGRAKSYAERLFEYIEIGPLSQVAAREALEAPVSRLGISYNDDALSAILKHTQAYPYFIQEWGKHCWNCTKGSSITLSDVDQATVLAISELDAGFFRVRFDRLTQSEKRYLRAMAELGEDSRRSGDISDLLGKKVQTVAPVRSALIRKGIIYSPSHGENHFTVPLFEGYLKRVMSEF